MEGVIVVAVFVILVLVTISLGVRIVPQGSKNVVQRLGKYHKTLGPGLKIILPYIDRVAYKVTTKDIVLDIPSQDVITRDNAVIIANAVAYINIISPEKSVYGVEDYRIAIQTLVQTSLRSMQMSQPSCLRVYCSMISLSVDIFKRERSVLNNISSVQS